MLKKLDDSQVEAFDTDYVEGGRWDVVKERIDRDFPEGEFNFLDVGGGNGVFTDRLLEAYPSARATVLDNSEVLLSRNKENTRKTLVCDSVENLGGITDKFDLVSVHWLLHHLVGASYRQTRHNQIATLRTLSGVLTNRGRISLFENMCNGWLFGNLPGWLVYQITSAKSIAVLTRRMGANTAGVGVCYLSKNEWFSAVEDSGFQVINYAEPDTWVWKLRPEWRIFLHVRNIRVGHMWLRAAVTGS